MKECIKCGALFDGVGCKACKRAIGALYRAANKAKIAESSRAYSAANAEKIAARSREWRANKPEVTRQYREANKSKMSDYGATYRAENKEAARQYWVARYAADPEKAKNRSAEYRSANPDKIKAASAAWVAAHPELDRINKQNRRARKQAVGGKLSKGLAKKLFALQNGKCPCCRLPLGDDYHMDHIIPLALGGPNTDENIQLLRQRCNNQKHAKDPVEFMQSRGFLI